MIDIENFISKFNCITRNSNHSLDIVKSSQSLGYMKTMISPLLGGSRFDDINGMIRHKI